MLAACPPRNALDETPARVDQPALIYPVVTLEPPFRRHGLPGGGHGFGMGHFGSPSVSRPGWYDAWLRSQACARA